MIGARGSLFLLYVCFAFIFLKTNVTFPLFLSIAGACVTRIEGFALCGTIGLCYSLCFDILRFPPFFELRDNARGTTDVTLHISALALFAQFATGTVLLFPVSVPFGIFASTYLKFSASLCHFDIFRYALPGHTFALIVGFDDIWASPASEKAFLGLAVPIPIARASFWYAAGQISSDVAPTRFTENVLRSPFLGHDGACDD
jgi:hypothetical protein